MNRIIILLLVLGLVACSETLDIQLEPEVTAILSNESNQQIRLTQKDEVYMLLNEWLHENRSDWFVTSGRYPGGVYIKSGNHGIQVTDSKVVIYAIRSDGPKAIYIQDLKRDELEKLRNFGK
ncbi:MAG: hypothetical protein OQK98_14450 [Gammaproteobacteria bacterium]|nr:hypothetical protein [Gammaproteobacteria bacterium]